MNLYNNLNRMEKNLQEVLDKWNKKILPNLPEHLDELASQTGAIQRKRGIRSAADLLKLLFLYACSTFSFRILAAASCALGISDISDTAWRKHFSGAVPFLGEILHFMLSSFIPFQTDTPALTETKNVLLIDASAVRQEGKQQNQQRIHLCYSLNQNRMQQIKITDQHTAESLSHFSMGKGDLVMADAGYGTAQNYIYSQEQQTDVILRITPKCFRLYDADGKKIPLVPLLKEAEEKHMEMIDIFGFCQYKNKSCPVRIIACRLPEKQTEEARKRKKKNASRKQRKITEDSLFCAGYITVLTSLGAEYSGEEILHLYRSRWQVELLFKRFKQNFSVTTIKAGNKSYAEAIVLLWLAIWVMTERQSFLAECFLAKKEETVTYSLYEKCVVMFQQIKEILCLSWGLFVDLLDKKYLRYLSPKKRRRINQNEEFHTTILPGFFA